MCASSGLTIGSYEHFAWEVAGEKLAPTLSPPTSLVHSRCIVLSKRVASQGLSLTSRASYPHLHNLHLQIRCLFSQISLLGALMKINFSTLIQYIPTPSPDPITSPDSCVHKMVGAFCSHFSNNVTISQSLLIP